MNVRQQRFCEFVVAGENQTDAYPKAGYRVSRTAVRKHAARMMTNDDISSRIPELRAAQTKTALRFLTDLIRTPLSEIGPDGPLCAYYSERVVGHTPEGEPIIQRTVRNLDPLRAIEIYSKMCGHFEPDRVEVDGGRKTLQSIKERAEEISADLRRKYGFI